MTKFSVVVGVSVGNVYLWNWPGRSRFGQKKAGNSNFIGGATVKGSNFDPHVGSWW